MKAHKYWSLGALVSIIGTFYTGYKGLRETHKYFAFGSLICMIMAIYSGHKLIAGNKKTIRLTCIFHQREVICSEDKEKYDCVG